MEGVRFFKKSNFKMENKGSVTRMGYRVKDFSVLLIRTLKHIQSVGANKTDGKKLKPEDTGKLLDQDLRGKGEDEI